MSLSSSYDDNFELVIVKYHYALHLPIEAIKGRILIICNAICILW